MDDQPEFSETTRATGEGMGMGCLAGGATSGCLIVMGGLLCLTGIGAIIGIPLILGGLLAPFLAPLVTMGSLKGPCPYCGTQAIAYGRAAQPSPTHPLPLWGMKPTVSWPPTYTPCATIDIPC